VEELHSYPDFRMGESGKFYEVLSRNKWRRFIPANERRSLLNSLHTLKHFGYTRILAGAEEAGFTWPLISEDVKEFLTDCGCSLAKKNRWKKMKWGKSEKSSECITSLISAWADSLGLNLCDLTFRG